MIPQSVRMQPPLQLATTGAQAMALSLDGHIADLQAVKASTQDDYDEMQEMINDIHIDSANELFAGGAREAPKKDWADWSAGTAKELTASTGPNSAKCENVIKNMFQAAQCLKKSKDEYSLSCKMDEPLAPARCWRSP